VYLGLVYIRWVFVHEVPYPFLEPGQAAIKLVLSVAGICVLFAFAALLVVAADKGAARLKTGQ
jgi:hypothetical protein